VPAFAVNWRSLEFSIVHIKKTDNYDYKVLLVVERHVSEVAKYTAHQREQNLLTSSFYSRRTDLHEKGADCYDSVKFTE
jgi:hypothetical protein